MSKKIESLGVMIWSGEEWELSAGPRKPLPGSFGEIASGWLDYIRPDIKESSFAQYCFIVERRLRPVFGDMPASKVTAKQVEEYLRELLRNGNLNSGAGLSPKSVSCQLAVIRQIFRYGLERGYLCPSQREIRGPRQRRNLIRVLTPGQQSRLEQAALKHRGTEFSGIFLSLYAGLRIGEVCGLRWGDIDLQERIIHVQRTVQRIQRPSVLLGEENSGVRTAVIVTRPKSDSSVRDIPLNRKLAALLQPFQGDKDQYVLTGTLRAMEPKNYRTIYREILKESGLDELNYHVLRHTFATRCAEQGFDLKSLSEILGHADVSVTLSRYVHPPMELKRHIMEELAENMEERMPAAGTGAAKRLWERIV